MWREKDGTAFESALQVDPEHGVSPVKLIDMRFIIALGELGGTMVRRQDLPKEAFIDFDTLKRMPHHGELNIISISHPWQQPDHPDPKEVNLQLLAKVMKIMLGQYVKGSSRLPSSSSERCRGGRSNLRSSLSAAARLFLLRTAS